MLSDQNGELVEITLPQAASGLLGHLTSGLVYVGAHDDFVGVWRYSSGGQPIILADYKADGDPDFNRFWRFASIAEKLLWGLRHEFDKTVECYTPEGLIALMERYADGRSYPPFTPEVLRSAGNLVRYATGWLLGREITVPLQEQDDHVALCLALESELGGGPSFEHTFTELRSA